MKIAKLFNIKESKMYTQVDNVRVESDVHAQVNFFQLIYLRPHPMIETFAIQ